MKTSPKDKNGLELILSKFGTKLLHLINNKQEDFLKVNEFVTFVERLYSTAKEQDDEEQQEWFMLFSAYLSKSDKLLAYINNLQQTPLVEYSAIESIFSSENEELLSQYMNSQLFHRILLSLAAHVLKYSQIPHFNAIVRFYLTEKFKNNDSTKSHMKVAISKLSSLFSSALKNQDIVKTSSSKLLLVCDNIIDCLVLEEDYAQILYLSHTLLATGSTLRSQKNPIHLDYWRKSFSIELNLQDKDVDHSSIVSIIKRLAVALVEHGNLEEAYEAISNSLGVLSKLDSIESKVDKCPPHLIWIRTADPSDNFYDLIFGVASKILLDCSDKIQPEFSNLSQFVEASALEQILIHFKKSSRESCEKVAVKVMERLEKLLEEAPLRLLRVYNQFSRSIGSSYESFKPEMAHRLLHSIIDTKNLGVDTSLRAHQYFILAEAMLSFSVFSDAPTTEQYRYLNNSVNFTVEMFKKDVVSDTNDNISGHIHCLSSFLDLQGAHEKRAELLKAVIEHGGPGSRINLDSEFIICNRLDMVKSLITLGYTGTAIREIESITIDDKSIARKIDLAMYYLRKVECYVSIGETKKASKDFEILVDIINKDDILKSSLLKGRLQTEDRSHFRRRTILFAEICTVLAKLYTEEVSIIMFPFFFLFIILITFF